MYRIVHQQVNRSVMLDKPKDAANLMSLVWANNGGGNVFLSKNSNKWIDKKINWSNYESVLDHIKNQQLGEDIYWTPLCFNDGNSRKSTNVKDNQGCLFVDMDELNVEWKGGIGLAPEPSIVWTTSKTRWQAIWLLSDVVPLTLQQELNKRLVYHLDADKGAWDSARVLRVPLSANEKRGGMKGRIQKFNEDHTYSLDDFDALPDITRDVYSYTSSDELPILKSDIPIENLPLEAQYWLGLTEKEYNEVKGVDRSDLIITLAGKLYKYKYNEDDIFSLLEPAHFNKFKNRPKTLYQQIKKAKNL